MTSNSTRVLTALVFTSVFSACGSSNPHNNETPSSEGDSEISSSSQSSISASLLEQDMTGTWQTFTKSKTFNLTTQEYSHESASSMLIFIDDQAEGIRQQWCTTDISDNLIFGDGRKTERYYYAGYNSYFELLENGNLFREYTIDPFYNVEVDWRDDYQEYMIKISDDFITNSGTFVLSSPVSLSESNQTCSEVWFSHTGQVRGASIIFPYKGDIAGIRLEFRGPIELGTYSYADGFESVTPIRMQFNYSEKFDEDLGFRLEQCYYDDMKNIAIEISVFDDKRITGSFSLDKEALCYNDIEIDSIPPSIKVEGEFDISLEHHTFRKF